MHVWRLSKAMALHFGVSTNQRSNTAKTTPPNTSAAAKSERCRFMRHHCTNRLNINVWSCCVKPGVSRFKPTSGSSGMLPTRPNSTSFEAPVSSESPSLSSSSSGKMTVRVCGPKAPRLSSSTKVGSLATSLPREMRWSKNCRLVTDTAPLPAMRTMSSLTTSGLGSSMEHSPSNQESSTLSTTPSWFLSTLFHSSSNMCARMLWSSALLTFRHRAQVSSVDAWLSPAVWPLDFHKSKSMAGLKSGNDGFWTSPDSTSINQSAGLSFCGI
mmetsp:Transcript_67866/g.190083  ORF Transcript_67866/g.190083 Transcript_67866/m.190083 type:complete len:270 (-) Transcript_67866:1049-1858(-)